MALEPRPPSMDRAGPPPLRLSPAVRSGARAPRPPRPDRTDGRTTIGPIIPSMHACIPPWPTPMRCGLAVSLLSALAVSPPWPRADYEAAAGQARRIAFHCMSCGDNRARVPPRGGPCPRPPASQSQASSRPKFPWAKRSETAKAKRERGVGSPASKQSGRPFPLLPFGLWQSSVPSLILLSRSVPSRL